LVVVLATLLAKTGLEVLQPWPMALLVDYVLKSEPLPETLGRMLQIVAIATSPEGLLGWVVVATVVIFLLEWALELPSPYARIGFGQRMVYDLAAALLDPLQRLSLGFHRRRPMGDSIRRVTKDSACISVIIEDALLPVLAALVSLLLMFSVMWQLDRVLT